MSVPHFPQKTFNSFRGACFVFQRISLDGSAMSCKSCEEESSLSLLRNHGVSSRQFVDMCLPSFRPIYLFLVRIPLDVIHECLKLRLEQRPDKDPSLLSLQSVSRGFDYCNTLLVVKSTTHFSITSAYVTRAPKSYIFLGKLKTVEIWNYTRAR